MHIPMLKIRTPTDSRQKTWIDDLENRENKIEKKKKKLGENGQILWSNKCKLKP